MVHNTENQVIVPRGGTVLVSLARVLPSPQRDARLGLSSSRKEGETAVLVTYIPHSPNKEVQIMPEVTEASILTKAR